MSSRYSTLLRHSLQFHSNLWFLYLHAALVQHFLPTYSYFIFTDAVCDPGEAKTEQAPETETRMLMKMFASQTT